MTADSFKDKTEVIQLNSELKATVSRHEKEMAEREKEIALKNAEIQSLNFSVRDL